MRSEAVFVAVGMVLALSRPAHARPEGPPLTPFSAPAELVAAVSDAEDFGTAADSVVNLWAHDFWLFTGTEAPMNMTTGGRGCLAGAFCGWAAGLQVPTGAQIRGVEFSACDGDAVEQVRFWVNRSSKVPSASLPIHPILGTGGPATPGCTSFLYILTAPVTVLNDVDGFNLVVNAPPSTTLEWNQFRVRYRLQVSPAPAVASFPNDVPTAHPFFRFVEALAAAGITGGCGPSAYCPDQPVTRGQMAVFFATALGLHFPN